MDKDFVAKGVAKKLMVTEAAVDSALVEASELMSEMLRARKVVGVSMIFADDAVAKLTDAIKALSEARSSMVAVHNELNEAKLLHHALEGQILAKRHEMQFVIDGKDRAVVVDGVNRIVCTADFRVGRRVRRAHGAGDEHGAVR